MSRALIVLGVTLSVACGGQPEIRTSTPDEPAPVEEAIEAPPAFATQEGPCLQRHDDPEPESDDPIAVLRAFVDHYEWVLTLRPGSVHAETMDGMEETVPYSEVDALFQQRLEVDPNRRRVHIVVSTPDRAQVDDVIARARAAGLDDIVECSAFIRVGEPGNESP